VHWLKVGENHFLTGLAHFRKVEGSCSHLGMEHFQKAEENPFQMGQMGRLAQVDQRDEAYRNDEEAVGVEVADHR